MMRHKLLKIAVITAVLMTLVPSAFSAEKHVLPNRVPLGLPIVFLERELGAPTRRAELPGDRDIFFWAAHRPLSEFAAHRPLFELAEQDGYFAVTSGDIGRIVEQGTVVSSPNLSGRKLYDSLLSEMRAFSAADSGNPEKYNIFGTNFEGTPPEDDGTNKFFEGVLPDGRFGAEWSLDGGMWVYRLLFDEASETVTLSVAQEYITAGREAATWSVEPITGIFSLPDAPVKSVWDGVVYDDDGWETDKRDIGIVDGDKATLMTFRRGATVAQYLLTQHDSSVVLMMSRWKSRDWHSADIPGLGTGMTHDDLVLMRGVPADIRGEFEDAELELVERFIADSDNTHRLCLLYWAYDQGQFDEINRVMFEDGRLSEVYSINGIYGVRGDFVDSEGRKLADELFHY